MRILFVSPTDIFPPNTGGMSRIYNLIKQLLRWHEVILVCPQLANPSAQDLPLRIYPIGERGRRQFVNPAYVWRLRSLIKQERPDIILTGLIWPGLAVLLARLSRRIPIFVDAHNVESHRFRTMGSRWWWAMSLYESLIIRLADQVFVVSEEDRRRLEQLGMSPEKAQLIPNGYDEERFYPDAAAGAAARRNLGVAAEERLLLYFGHLGYPPNVEGLELLHREILPRLDRRNLAYRLVVAGRGATDKVRQQLGHPRVLFVGLVERIEDLINAADVVAVPLLRGGGTRIKIIESIACGRPVVSTPTGAEGLDRTTCADRLIIADGWDAFACALKAAAVRPSGATAVPPAFRERYSWSPIGERIHFDVR